MKKGLLIIVSGILLIISGCGYKDIDRRFFVVSIGVDKGKGEGMYDITLKLAVPSSETKTGSNEAKIITEKAQTISEAVRIIKSKVDKELDFSHAKMIVIGEELAEKDLTNIFDWFFRRRDIQSIAWTAIGSPDALTILEAKPPGERVPSNALFLTFGSVGTETPYITSTYIFDFRRKQTERGIDPVLPIIKMEAEGFSVNETSVFSDMKQVLKLSQEETKYFSMLTNEATKYDIKVEKEGGKPYFVFSTDEVLASFQLKEDKIMFDVNLSGIVEESFEKLDEGNIKEYEDVVKKEVEEQIKSLVQIFQKEKVDPIGLGLRYRATHIGKEAEKIKKWEELYPTLQIDANINVKMENVGIIHDQEGYPE